MLLIKVKNKMKFEGIEKLDYSLRQSAALNM